MSVTAAEAESRRAGREVVLELVFRPPANALVPIFERAKVPPPAVVLANAAVGLLGALVLYRGELVGAALLLQLKTLLDNADGALARATGQVTTTGRYLDTIADLVVNAAVFAALGYVTGQPLLALAAFVALTLVLAVDFNVTDLYRHAQGTTTPDPPSSGGALERALAFLYRSSFGVLDRIIRGISTRRFGDRPAYDGVAVTALANLGLSTQLAVLGACLAVGVPALYLWLVLGCLLVLAALHVRAELRVRRLS
jgi:archaetidylinositol phosphate synthase